MNAGDTVIVALRDTSVDSHLWAVISDPTQSDNVLIVNFTSWRIDKDQACILDRGDHPYLTHRTCVNYKKAKLCEAVKLDRLVEGGQIEHDTPLTPKILARIREAVPESWITCDHAQILVTQNLVDF